MSERGKEALRLLRSSLDQPGPARRISQDREAEIARAVCEETGSVRVPSHGRARWLGRAAAAVALGSALSAAAALGWMRLRASSSEAGVSAVPALPPAPARPAAAGEYTAEPITPRLTTRAPSHRKTAAVSSPRAAPPPVDPLERANRLRAERRWREAADAYAAVAAEGPPRAASVAAVARATLLLGPLRSPREALVLFRRALSLAPDGPVSDEALYGIAASFRALDNEIEERAAIRRFLAERPSSPLRGQAERRLAELPPTDR